ncbi:hypothetical protein [Sediminicoccus sp. BL-A-41-H5]|uniref:hypothetical protein n=1 Tax=Sediminicoccus sp. BL-A-41-H5 TaxID=3421106 RepID=UPI003D66E249
MRNLLLAAPLLMAALPAAAETGHVWTGSDLVVNGATMNGCNIQVTGAIVWVGTNNPLRVQMYNAGERFVWISAHTVITGPQGTKVNPEFRASMMPYSAYNIMGGGEAPQGSLANTRLTVDITNCAQRG